jgi:hypothetical protein
MAVKKKNVFRECTIPGILGSGIQFIPELCGKAVFIIQEWTRWAEHPPSILIRHKLPEPLIGGKHQDLPVDTSVSAAATRPFKELRHRFPCEFVSSSSQSDSAPCGPPLSFDSPFELSSRPRPDLEARGRTLSEYSEHTAQIFHLCELLLLLKPIRSSRVDAEKF